MSRLRGKRILVTGAATGIGRATAIRVASEGARVAMFDINDAGATETLATIEGEGGKARYWHVNIADETAVIAAVDEAAQWMGGGLDVLLHIAGVLHGAGVELTDLDDGIWDPVIDVNVKGSYLMSKHLARYMKAQESGVIVLTASGSGVLEGSSSIAYGHQQGRRSRAGSHAPAPSVPVRHQSQRCPAGRTRHAPQDSCHGGSPSQHRRQGRVRALAGEPLGP